MGLIPRSLHVVAAAAALCLSGGANAAASIPTGHERVLVTAHAGGLMAVKQALASLRGRDVRQVGRFDIVGVTLPKAAIDVLRAVPAVRAVEPNAPRYLAGTRVAAASRVMASKGFTPADGITYRLNQKVPFGIFQSQANMVSDSQAGNRKLCIIDSGLNRDHPDHVGQSANLTGWPTADATYGDWFTDENGHGTHVAGTVAGLNNDTGVVGVMPNGKVKLHIAKVFDAEGSTGTETILQAVLECQRAGANVLSMSLGGPLNLVAEQIVYEAMNAAGILVIAAAGNDGNTRVSYPAGYPSVVSVGALTESNKRASFSQFNADVELSAAGENVLSTVPEIAGREAVTKVAGVVVESNGMDGSPVAEATAALVDLGRGKPTDPVVPGAEGKVCLIERGEVSFAEKVQTCERNKGVAAILYNNQPGNFGGTMGTTVTTIPSVSISREDGLKFIEQLKAGTQLEATVALRKAFYAYFNGTSMATPHVSAVATLAWSYAPQCTNADVRAVLAATSKDLGAPRRDPSYGHGLVQAEAAAKKLQTNCGR
jgi:subtilisin family serine protease